MSTAATRSQERPQAVSDQYQYHWQCLTPSSLASRRISDSALGNYVQAVLLELKRHFEKPCFSKSIVQIAILLSKDADPVIEAQYFGLPLEDSEARGELQNGVSTVLSPALQSGAVGLVICTSPETIPRNRVEFFAPFTDLSPQILEENKDIFKIAGGEVLPESEKGEFYNAVPAQRARWRQMVDAIIGRKPPLVLVAKSYPDSPLLPESITRYELADIEQAIIDNPERMELLVARAEWHSLHNNNEQAIVDFDKAIAINSAEPRLYHLRGCCFANLNNMAQALVNFEQAISIHEGFSRARFCRARVLLEIGAHAEAYSELEVCIALRPFEVDYQVLLSELKQSSDETEAALEIANRIKILDPHCASNIGWSAFLNRMLNRFDDVASPVEELSHAVELDPRAWRIRFERAIWQSFSGNWEQVVSGCDAVLDICGENGEVLALRAMGQLELKNLEKAQSDIERAFELGCSSPQDRLTRVRCHLAVGETATILDELNLILEESPNNVFVICLKGDYHHSMGENENSLTCYRDALQVDPENGYIHEKMACVLCELGQTEESLKAIEQALEFDNSNPHFHFTQSWLLLHVNQLDGALESINRAIQLDSSNPGTFFHRARVLLAMTNRVEAIKDLDRAIEIAPDYGDALALRAQLHRDNACFELAENDYNCLIKQFPDNFYAYSLRAGLRTQMGLDHLAANDLRTAIEMNPGEAESMILNQELTRGDSHFENEEYALAIEIYSDIITNQYDCVPAFCLRATSYWYNEQFVESIDDYIQVLQLQDDDEGSPEGLRLSTLGCRGQVYAELGEYELAIADLNQVINADSKDACPLAKAYALNGRGLAYAGLSRIDAAEADFRESISIAADNAWVYYNQGLCYFKQEKLEDAKRSFVLAIELTNPKLTPRKRKKAESFVESCTF